ncbi:acyl-CoA thioesterase [Thalassorhabdomicrobium marinisediminis]|uniref:acyl-CoA thioesterase n=1 Tax=Thalassorhabdomicrobium marinisediminis TaxID=2170577 RepID=UPI0024901D5A|nr:thioesterase family protein [Thalassorhabdomicrobium marinisediminis]
MTPYLTPLTDEDLRAAGIPAPWSYGMADRVRFGEVDMLHHVNNVVYLRWYETLRVHYMDDYGIYTKAGPEPKLVVKSVSLDYRAEVTRGASYINVARTTEMRNTSFAMEYATFVDGRITTTGAAVVVLLNADNSKRPLPDALRDTLRDRDGAVQL